MVIREAIQKTIEGHNLSLQEAYEVTNQIMEGNATDAQIAALIRLPTTRDALLACQTPREVAALLRQGSAS